MTAALGHLARRLGWAALVVLGAVTLSFFVAHVLPGDPARMLVGPQASAADVTRAREVYGLDRPVAARYLTYLTRLVHLGRADVDRAAKGDHASCAALGIGLHVDLGHSFHYRRPVVEVLRQRIPRSIELAVAGLFLQLALGLSVGVSAAARRGSRWDQASMAAMLVGVSAPTFVIGVVLQHLFAHRLGWLPLDGYGETAGEHLRSLVLPALTLGIFGAALYARIARDELSGLLAQDFIRTARAKGASEGRVLVVHALRNALLPIATLAALDLGALIGGAIVTERLFRWPGVGQAAVVAMTNRDGSLLVGTVLFASTAVVLSTLSLDLLGLLLDPRVRRA